MKRESELLGLPLGDALALCKREGWAVNLVDYASRRGVEGANEKRVLRATRAVGGVCLIISAFKTDL